MVVGADDTQPVPSQPWSIKSLPSQVITMDGSSKTSATDSSVDSYRELVVRGLAPWEAANITAILAGISIAAKPWALREVVQLVFLRELREAGAWGPNDGGR